MNAWLVLVRCGMEDVPLALFGSRKEALDYAAGVGPQCVYDAAWLVYELGHADLSQPVSLALVYFEDGRPTEAELVRDLEE